MPQTLLLADDSLTIQRVIELTFADEDIDVVAVSDGDQAIARIDSEPPDIVLVDVGMPGRNGYEVARHVKHTRGLDHIPVLLLTGAFEPVEHDRAAEAGCDGILAKPFEPQQVIARVKELLARTGPERRQTPRAPVPADAPAARPDRTPASEVARLDSYFAQLDAAFASLSESRPAEETASEPSSSSLLSIDWFSTSATQPGPSHDVPVAPLEPAPANQEAPIAAAPLQQKEPEAPAASPTPPPPPPIPLGPPPAQPAPEASQSADVSSLADAFAAILASEQHEPIPQAAAWPAPTPPPAAGEALSEEAMEEITRRVLERISDRVVRETVAGLVSDIAERLVREEIERIKASIQ